MESGPRSFIKTVPYLANRCGAGFNMKYLCSLGVHALDLRGRVVFFFSAPFFCSCCFWLGLPSKTRMSS